MFAFKANSTVGVVKRLFGLFAKWKNSFIYEIKGDCSNFSLRLKCLCYEAYNIERCLNSWYVTTVWFELPLGQQKAEFERIVRVHKSSLWPQAGPAVLGLMSILTWVYECVIFTLFALMYITMSKYSNLFWINIEKRTDKKNLMTVLLQILYKYTVSILIQCRKKCFEGSVFSVC